VRRGFSAVPNFVTSLRTSWLIDQILDLYRRGQNEDCESERPFEDERRGCSLLTKFPVSSISPNLKS